MGGGGGQGGCERRIEVFVKIKRRHIFFLGGGRSDRGEGSGLGWVRFVFFYGGGGGRVGGGGCQGGCERKNRSFCENSKKKYFFWGGFFFLGGGAVRSGGGVVGLGVRLDVNEELKFL